MGCRNCGKPVELHSAVEVASCLTSLNRAIEKENVKRADERREQAQADADALEIGHFVLSGGWCKPSKIVTGQYIAWTAEEFDGAGPTIIEAIRIAQQHEREVHAKRAAAVAAG